MTHDKNENEKNNKAKPMKKMRQTGKRGGSFGALQ